MDYTQGLFYNAPGVQTPEQVKSTIDYAKALMTGSGQQPVRHWTQGISNVVNALIGGDLDYRAAQAQKRGIQDFAAKEKTDIPMQNYPTNAVGTSAPPPFPAPLPGRTSFNDGPSSAGGQNSDTADASLPRGIRNNNPLNIESGDFTKSQPGYAGSDGRFARFERPEQGVAAASALLDNYERRGLNTVAGIISRWAPVSDGNDVSAYARNVSKQLGVDPNQPLPPAMRQQLIAAMAQHENGRPVQIAGLVPPSGGVAGATPEAAPIAFTGPSDVSNVPAVAAMAQALRGGPSDAGGGGTQVAGGKAVPNAPINLQKPDPQAGQTMINPALIKPQPGYTTDQLQAVMEHPWATPEQREAAHQMMLRRGQTIEMRSPTGVGTVLVDPNNPLVQQYIKPEPHWGTEEISETGIKRPTATTFGPSGQPEKLVPPAATVGPRSEAPVAPAGAVNPVGGTPGTPAAENALPGTTGAPVRVASTDPASGISTAAATVAKPTVPAVPAVQSPVGPLAQFFASPIPGMTKEDSDTIQGLRAAKNAAEARQHQILNDQDVNKAAQEKTADFSIKKYDNMSTQAQEARKLMPNLDLALSLMNDPNFHSGLLKGAQDTWARFKDATGIQKMANAPNEAFDKIMAGTVLGTMRSTLQGLGQVRLAEIDLLNRANANRYNTDASNRAVMEISRRGLQKIDQLDSMAQDYVSGGDVLNPVTGDVMLKGKVDANGDFVPRKGLDSGFDKLARKFTLDHPSFSSDEIKNYNNIFETGKPIAGEATPTGKTNDRATQEAPAVGTERTFKQGIGVWDGKQWVPKAVK